MEPTLEGARALALSATGPLSPHLEAFIASLVSQQYAVRSLRSKSWHATAFDAWLAEHSVDLAEVSDIHIDQFHGRRYQPRSDCRTVPRRYEVAALRQLLSYLRKQGICAPSPVTATPVNDLVARFAQFLQRDRGLAPGSVSYCCTGAKGFLIHRFGVGPVNLGVLNAADVIGFVRDRACQVQPRSLKQVITALRALLRYGQFLGEIDTALIDAVPAASAWSTTPPLPKAIAPEHAQRAINSCDLGTAMGLRDRAILLLLARLGLRGGEVIDLLLGDINWDTGCLRVRGKNGRECLMPMPTEVGDAIATYLQHGRPLSADRHLFLRTRAPLRGLLHGSDGVGSVVRHALIRAGIDAPHKGSHQFRHALAVRMLKDGASLPEIGEVLRHRSPLSTAIYAKVDVASLRPLALPWPGGAS